jgi:peptidoglycan/LPS O-acetylase OafA/YrhL
MTAPPHLWPARYKVIDGWRALAALIVVCHHLGLWDKQNAGHVAVLVFFVISGYCIAATSESCLRHGHGFATYMSRRLRRIYPPYFFAVCFFAATRILKWKLGGGMQLSGSIPAWLQTLTLTQWLSLIPHPATYAAQNKTLFVAAFWSLNYEEQFYLVIGGLMVLSVRFRRPILWGVLALIIPAFAWNLMYPSISYGFFLEYWVHFSLGVIVYYRLCRLPQARARRAIDIGISILVVASLAMWIFHDSGNFASQRSVYAEWFITGAFALFLIAARSLDDALAASWLGARLVTFGALTYSLYLVHQFNEQAAAGAARLLFRIGVPRFFKYPIEILWMIAIAAVFWYFCERRYINRPLDSGARTPIASAAGARLAYNAQGTSGV